MGVSKPFTVGDVVHVDVAKSKTWMSHFNTGFDALVIEVSRSQGRYQYGVGSAPDDCCWWYAHEDLSLIKKATDKTTIQAYRLRDGEE